MPALISLLYGVAAVFGAAFAVVELRMLLRFLRNRDRIRAGAASGPADEPGGRDRRPPTVTIQLPLYNERTSAERIVRAAAAQDYPRERFDIQVLDDSTDETSEIVARVVEELRAEGVAIEHLRRTDRTGYKAGALTEGLRRSDAELVALFDADFVPEPDFLARVAAGGAFDDPDVAFVQARWAWESDVRGLLPSALALLLDRHFAIQKPTRAFAGNVMTFNGSAGIWRRSAIDEAGGWTADTLTEDLDLSYRCALRGWKGRYFADVRVANELPDHMRAFKLQQRRWAKGNAQCFRKLTTRVMSSRGVVRDRLDEAFILAGYAIHPLLLASVLLWPWAVLHVDRRLFLGLQALMSLGMVAALVSFLLTIRERDGRLSMRAVGELVFGMGVGMGLMVNNTVGQIEGLVRSGGEFLRTPKRAAASTPHPRGRTVRTRARRASTHPRGPAPIRLAAAGAAGGGAGRSAGPRAAAILADGDALERLATLAAAAPRAYALPLDWTFFAEILVLGYCLGGAALLVQAGEGMWAFPMVMWAACMALMVQQQMHAARPS